MQLTVPNTYGQAGEYLIVVKVIDILGNDMAKAISITIR